jgi:hypothetical protein
MRPLRGIGWSSFADEREEAKEIAAISDATALSIARLEIPLMLRASLAKSGFWRAKVSQRFLTPESGAFFVAI